MPLLPGYSRTIVSQNIKILCRETDCHDTAQHRRNVAIALSTARAYWRAHGFGETPAHLLHTTAKRAKKR